MKTETLVFDVNGHKVSFISYTDEATTDRDAVLIFPGGGYEHLSTEREGDAIARAYLREGVNAFVVHYAVGEEYKYPSHLIDASYAICYLKENAAKYGINKNRIFTVGFSAGGHLAGSLAVLHHDQAVLSSLGIERGQNRPCGAILAYPVVSANVPTHGHSFEMLTGKPFAKISDTEKDKLSLEKNVNSDSSPMFIWHTSEDPAVPMLGSLRLAEAYYMINRHVSLHIYPYGTHGIALANEETSLGNPDWVQPLAQTWIEDSVKWMKSLKSY